MKDHKYSGSDAGLSYIYFYNPVSKWIVANVIPEWLAPNTLTLIGFVHSFGPLVLMFIIGGFNLVEPLPWWWYVVQAWCYLVYRLFDEFDGK